MIFNYIKIAWRNLVSQKLFSLINISGLAVGLAVCMMIMLYVTHELSYDRFHTNAERIVKPLASFKMNGSNINMEFMSYSSGPVLKQTQPTVDSYMRLMAYFKPLVLSTSQTPASKFTDDKLLFADPEFFSFFSFKLLKGVATDVLKKPFSVVITKNIAKKYFGDTDPVGKLITIKTDSVHTYQVTGVAENAPSNSSIDFNFVASNSSLLAMKEAKDYTGTEPLSFGNYSVYLMLKHASDTSALRRNLNAVARNDKRFEGEMFSLAPLVDTHLKHNFGDYSNIKYLKIFPLVAILILLLALVNYMSLSTARATLRAKEVGVRKVSGASRAAIATQFYVESALFAVISFVLGYVLCYALIPWFLNVLQLKIDNSFLYSPEVLMLLFGLLTLTILIAGSYPSLVLSAFKPVITLKGKMSRQAGGVAIRKIFTTLQFAISVGLIICGIIIDRQLYYVRHAYTGINRENVIMIPVGNSMGVNYPAFQRDVKALSGVENTATSHYGMFQGYDMYQIDGKTKEETMMLSALAVDEHFMSTLDLKWKYPPVERLDGEAGRVVVLNEEAIFKLHLPANPVGTYLKSGDQKTKVVGVVKNFNFSSMASAISPLGLYIAPGNSPIWGKFGCNLFARIKPHTNLPSMINSIKGIYGKYDQDKPFNYTFMDDAFNQQYKAEDRLAAIFSIFTYITIILATLGLFGLAAFTIEQRTKEIGIRKVLGASIASINALLSADFLKLVVLSIVIASPIAWWTMHNWLQNFAYRINISWWVFVAAGFVAVLTAVVTVSYHAIRAAIANPVSSLRSE